MAPEFWRLVPPALWSIEDDAREAERAGWDGLLLIDSQNLNPDTYVALTLAARATTTLGLGSGVTNPVTRHSAVTAGAMASIQYVSGGRAVLGIGRGDSALFNIGHEPAPVAVFERYLKDLQGYLAGATLDKNGYASKLHWLEHIESDKVPIDVAATGPRVIAVAARWADRVTFALGANPDRVRWGIEQVRGALAAGKSFPSLGLYLNVCVHDDTRRAAEMMRASVGTFAHFSGMGGAPVDNVPSGDREVFRALGEGYDRPGHGKPDSAHAKGLPLDFIERFAVVGPPEHCRGRIDELRALGIHRFVIFGPNPKLYGEDAIKANQRFAREVMPALKE